MGRHRGAVPCHFKSGETLDRATLLDGPSATETKEIERLFSYPQSKLFRVACLYAS